METFHKCAINDFAFIKTSENVDFSMFKWISVYPLNEINSRFLNGQMSFC